LHYELCTKKIEWYSALFDISKQVTINVTCLKATNTSYNNEAQNSLNENKTKETRHSVSEIHRTGEKMYICMVPPFSEFLNIRQLCWNSPYGRENVHLHGSAILRVLKYQTAMRYKWFLFTRAI